MRIGMFLIAAAIVTVLLSGSLAAAQTRQDILRNAQGNLPSRTASPADDPKGPVGSLSGKTSGDLLTLGSVWQVQECCGWSGTWTRRAGMNRSGLVDPGRIKMAAPELTRRNCREKKNGGRRQRLPRFCLRASAGCAYSGMLLCFFSGRNFSLSL